MWQRRADTYVDLLDWCERMSFLTYDLDQFPRQDTDLPAELHARARVFASPYVYNMLEHTTGYHSMRMLKATWRKGTPPEQAEEMVCEFKDMLDMTHKLSLAIREDMASDLAATDRPADAPKDLPALPRLPAGYAQE